MVVVVVVVVVVIVANKAEMSLVPRFSVIPSELVILSTLLKAYKRIAFA